MEHTDAGDCAVLAHSVTGVIQSVKETVRFYKVINYNLINTDNN